MSIVQLAKKNIVVTIITIAILLLIVFLIVKKLKKYIRNKKNKELLETSTVQGTTVNGQPVAINLGYVASEIYESFYNNDWFGASEDEERAVNAVSGVPKALMKDLSDLYYNLYKKVLREDFAKYVLDDKKYQSKIGWLFS